MAAVFVQICISGVDIFNASICVIRACRAWRAYVMPSSISRRQRAAEIKSRAARNRTYIIKPARRCSWQPHHRHPGYRDDTCPTAEGSNANRWRHVTRSALRHIGGELPVVCGPSAVYRPATGGGMHQPIVVAHPGETMANEQARRYRNCIESLS